MDYDFRICGFGGHERWQRAPGLGEGGGDSFRRRGVRSWRRLEDTGGKIRGSINNWFLPFAVLCYPSFEGIKINCNSKFPTSQESAHVRNGRWKK